MKIAAIQHCAGSDWHGNLVGMAEQIDVAVDAGAALVVLPENFACYGGDYRALAVDEAPLLPQWLQQQSRHHGVWILAGSVPLATRPDGSPVPAPRVRTATLVYSPDGECVSRYDKLHLFDVDVGDAQGRYQESDLFEPGDAVVLTNIGGLQVGLMICYDLRFPLLAQRLRDRGAELLVYPSAFTALTGRAHWEALLRARAIENGCFVLGANQCGQHQCGPDSAPRHSYGHSMLLDPWGGIVAALSDQPGILMAELDLALIQNTRRRLPLQQHQRLTITLPDDLRDL
ncbi:MAG: carbon-nitrogen hydrolase family protein [Gammaproteobacteria bacterium HGW-Gammaproteobacteria-14]|nr:MAG: carbon-nitrogen hydrolase family protein [Gammaproteobacteria bacterium HGW-Gammaproteobacteria-14]